jgi:pimeloyl-ACP methyl ester carboxylesterase
LGIILPGYRYPPEMAPLFYAGRILLEQGADLLRVEYAYYRTNFIEQPEPEQDRWISSDVFAACNAALAHREYEKITLVGKSIGTIALGHLLSDRRFQEAACIWLTPLLTAAWLRSRIEQIHPRSLFVIGTADKYCIPDTLDHLVAVTHGQVTVIEGADHALQIPDSISGSLRALDRTVQALQEFLEEEANNT